MSFVSRRDMVKALGALAPLGFLAGSAARAEAPVPSAARDDANEDRARAIIAEIKPAVVLLEVETERSMGWGSGFFISSDGLLITNRHVVEDAQKVTCLLKNNKKYSATVVKVDEQYDMALVQVEVTEPVVTVALGDSDAIQAGQLIGVTGYPEPQFMVWTGIALDSSSSRGCLNGIRYGSDNHAQFGDTVLQIDAPVTHGNSGGPVYRLDTGEVIGILASQLPGAGNAVFAVPINPARVLASSAGKKLQARRAVVGSPEAVIEPGDLRALNTISVTKELPALFGYGFPLVSDYDGESTIDAVRDWVLSTGTRLSRISPLVLQGKEIFFGTTDGKLRKWDTTRMRDHAPILLDAADNTIFVHAPVVNDEIICATSGALDLASRMGGDDSFGAVFGLVMFGIAPGSKENVSIAGKGHIFGLNRRNGNLDWEVETGFVGTPVLYDKKVFYGGMGERGCLDALQGKEVWRLVQKQGSKADWIHMGYAGASGVFGIAVPVEGKRKEEEGKALLLYGNGKARVERYDPASNKVLWKKEIGDLKDRLRPLSTAMFVDEAKKVVYALAGQVVAALNAEDGKILWVHDQAKKIEQEMKRAKDAKKKARAVSFTANMLVHDGMIYVGATDRKLHAFNGADGQEMWTYNTRGEVGPPTYHQGQILFGTADGYVHVIDARTGALSWRVNVMDPVLSQPLVHQGMVYVATQSGGIFTVRIPTA